MAVSSQVNGLGLLYSSFTFADRRIGYFLVFATAMLVIGYPG